MYNVLVMPFALVSIAPETIQDTARDKDVVQHGTKPGPDAYAFEEQCFKVPQSKATRKVAMPEASTINTALRVNCV